MSVSEDMISLVQSAGIGIRHQTLFTTADQGAYENRPLVAIFREEPSATAPDVTVDADHINVYVDVSAPYEQNGEASAYAMAHAIYRAMRLRLDEQVGNYLYYCIKSNPPAHLGYMDGRSTYQLIIEVFRYLGGLTNGN